MKCFQIASENPNSFNSIKLSIENSDNYCPWVSGPSADWVGKHKEIIYDGQDLIDMGEKYFGILFDLGITKSGIEVEVNTHPNFYCTMSSPLLIPAIYGTDWWSLPSLLVFCKNNSEIKLKLPIGVCKTVIRSQTKIVELSEEEENKSCEFKNEQSELRKTLPTRIINLPGLKLDNFYEIMSNKYRKGEISALCSDRRIFQKGYMN